MAHNRTKSCKEGDIKVSQPLDNISFEDIDQESALGTEPERLNSTRDENANLGGKTKSPKRVSRKESTSSSTQCLLKGDRVFAFTTEQSSWTCFLKRQSDNCKYVTGNVVLRKEWKDSNLSLYIRWENGKFERLRGSSEHVAYGDRIFVLDRECVEPGSRVYLAGYPDYEGTVVAKRYVATASDCENPDVLFEDIDASSLVRHSHGDGYKGNKILYQGWLGLTSEYRVRVYLKSLSESGMEGGYFSVVLNSYQAQDLEVGKTITLGISLLRAADFSEELGSNWLINFFRYFNTTALIEGIEIEELMVNWVGKVVSSEADPNPIGFEMDEAPEHIICRDNLVDVKYLAGDPCMWMCQGSLWKFQFDDATKSITSSSNPITRIKWMSKWLKKLDWDRWEYPPEQEIKNKQKYLEEERILKIMYTRAVFDVLWTNGKVTTLDADDVIPVHAGSVWSEMLRFRGGTIVTNLLKREDTKTYGVISAILDSQTATVKWINPEIKDNPLVTECAMPLYDLDKKSEYDYISKANNCPIVSSTCGLFKVGAAKNIDPKSGKVCVKLSNGEEIHQWPHEIVHFRNDIFMCPVDGNWISWYEHVIPPYGISPVAPAPEEENEKPKETDTKPEEQSFNESFVSEDLVEALALKKKVEGVDEVPEDNIFDVEDWVPRLRECNYRRTVETEVEEMENFLPDGMWIEYYRNRGDIMSAVVTGPSGSIFEDFLFIFDIFLLEDFPKSEPHLNFRSMGITILPGHFCKSGAVFLPEETRLSEDEFTFSYILNLLLEVKDFMAVPLEVIQANDRKKLTGNKYEDPEELFKFVLLNVLDYAVATLKNPPKNWSSVILQHYETALPRIIEKYKTGHFRMKRAPVSLRNEKDKGEFPKFGKLPSIPVPWSETYSKSIRSRIDELGIILSSLGGK